MTHQRTAALEAMARASEMAEISTEHEMRYHLAVADIRATLWLGELIADLTSAVREMGNR